VARATSLHGHFYPIMLRTLGKVSHGTYNKIKDFISSVFIIAAKPFA
jgi:hypothetical protein